jgi:ABC-type multidrug transport system ATPase subunit
MAEVAISVEGARFSYGEREVLKGVTFEVARGEVLGFLGPNGAGKSTTIRMLTGQLRPSSGQVRVLGRDVTAERSTVMARVGVSFEEKNLYPSMSGRRTCASSGASTAWPTPTSAACWPSSGWRRAAATWWPATRRGCASGS